MQPENQAEWPFFGSDLDTAYQSTAGYMRKHYPVVFWIFVIACAWVLACFVIIIPSDGRVLPEPLNSVVTTLAIPLLGLSVAYAVFSYLFVSMKMSKEFAEHFAAIMGYSFTDTAPLSTVSGDIFKLGDDALIYNVVSGTYRGHPLRIFEYQFSGRGNNRRSRGVFYTVLEIKFTHSLPEMHIMQSATDMERTLSVERAIDVHYSSSMKISLEGEFDKYFSVYAPPGTQIGGLQIMSPEFMDFLMEHRDAYRNTGFECSMDKLYVHIPGQFGSKRIKDFTALYSLADALLPKLDSVKA